MADTKMRHPNEIKFYWGDWNFEFEQMVIAQFEKTLANDLKENPPELHFSVGESDKVTLQLSMLFANGDSDKLTWVLSVDPEELIAQFIEDGEHEGREGRILSATLRRYADMLDKA